MIQIGYYGKSIHKGDFVRFNLPKSFITVIDDWLQSVMIHAESLHGNNWPALYTACTGYRFYLSPNIAGEHAWTGFFINSTDKVGRRFPFCIAASIPANHPPAWNDAHILACMLELESAVNTMEDPAFDFEMLQSTLAMYAEKIAAQVDSGTGITKRAETAPQPDHYSITTLGAHAGLEAAVSASILDNVLQQAWFNYSIWTPIQGNADKKGLVTTGLPQVDAAMALFDYQWEHLPIGSIEFDVQTMSSAADVIAASSSVASADVNTEVAQSMDSLDTDLPDVEAIEDTPAESAWTALEETKSDEPAAVQPTDNDAKQGINENKQKTRIEPLELDDDGSTTAPWE